MRLRRSWILRGLAGLVLLGAALTGGPGPGAGAPSPAHAQETTGSLLLPVTIDNIGPLSTSYPTVQWLGLSGDWAAYGAGTTVCGHCGSPIHTIYLRNMRDGTRRTLHTATLAPQTSDGYGAGAEKIQFACPSCYAQPPAGPRLVWEQPAPMPPGDLETFRPGDYTCTRCYYDPETGQGGAFTDLALPADPPLYYEGVIESNATGDDPTHSAVVALRDRNSRQVVARATLPPGARIEQITSNDTRILFVQTRLSLTDGSILDSPQLIRYASLQENHKEIQQVWTQADAPVAAGTAPRSWLWGPRPLFASWEAYGAGPRGTHFVQYYDKARMEINNPASNATDPYYVTNGLLTVEMIGGEIQTGLDTTIRASVPCTIPVAGDPRKDNPLTPGYSTLAAVASLHGEHQAPDRQGQPVSDALDVAGAVSQDTAHAALARYAAFAPQTGHNIPDVFWTYLQGMQGTYGFTWQYVLGYPITDAYWTQMRVSGKDYPVLIQAYQRRVLTYIPDFDPVWRVQQGNVGQHYLEWRYTRP